MKICKTGRIWGQINSYKDTLYLRKQRETHLGNKNPNWKGGITLPYIKKGWNPNSKGKRFATGQLIGSKGYNWKGCITPINALIRSSVEYKIWRKAIFERDHYTCLICGEVGGRINAHHIKPFSKFPELRFKVSNGVTLCKKCHYLKPINYKKKESELYGTYK